jgi:hypothetical protein
MIQREWLVAFQPRRVSRDDGCRHATSLRMLLGALALRFMILLCVIEAKSGGLHLRFSCNKWMQRLCRRGATYDTRVVRCDSVTSSDYANIMREGQRTRLCHEIGSCTLRPWRTQSQTAEGSQQYVRLVGEARTLINVQRQRSWLAALIDDPPYSTE